VAPDPARGYAGKFATPEVVQAIRHKMGLDKPRWLDGAALGRGEFGEAFDSQFVDILTFRFGQSMRWEEPLWTLIKRKAPASMTIQVPAFIIVLGLQLALAVFVAFKRGRWQDYLLTFLAVLGMSVPALSVYIAAQWLLGQELGIFPVAGWESGVYAVHFAALPILLSVLMGIGGGVRFYRTVVLEEVNQDYVRTARAKGVAMRDVMFSHVLRNVMIPVVTSTVVALPGLILGALLLERIFQIPGLGNLMVDAISNNDRSVVMAMTYILSIVYCLLLLATDICYALVDPRVSLK
jgi:peptide/nickel transport system permease protein